VARRTPDTSLTRLEVQSWVFYQGLGLTPADAEAWSERGYGPGVAAAALVDQVSLAQVDELAAVFRDAGVWDGTSRADLTDLIGWHLDVDSDVGYPYPVLARWLAFPLPRITERLGDVVEAVQAGRLTSGPSSPSTPFTNDPIISTAAGALADLEGAAVAGIDGGAT
jgi:hypothetical protein